MVVKRLSMLLILWIYFSALPAFALNNFSEIAEFQEIEAMPEERAYHQCVFVNKRLYCIGGLDKNSNATRSVWYADVQNDRTLGKWEEAEEAKNRFPETVNGHQCFIANNYIYCAGGKNTGIDSIWYSKIQSDNSIGEWKESTQCLPKKLSYHQCFTTNGYIYCAGGYDGSSYSKIWFTKNKSNGELEEWKSTTDLPKEVHAHQCISANGYIYFIGGYNSETKTYCNHVWYTKSQTDGNLSDWESTTSILEKMTSFRCFSTNGNLYCSGGHLGNDVHKNDIWYAQWNSNGRINKWVSTTNKLPGKLRAHQILSLNSFIYSCGGYPYTNKTYLSFILPDLKTHQNEDYWYITDKLELNLASEYELGYWYIINNSSNTEVKGSNNIQYSKETLLTLTTGLAVEHGTHYLHFSLANTAKLPNEKTYHFKFKNFATLIDVSSVTHPNQHEWYSSNNCIIKINNLENGIKIRYVVDNQPDTIPDSSSEVHDKATLDNDSFANPGNQPGTNYIHIRAEDSLGTLAPENLTTHFRFNISDPNNTTPQSLPIVKDLSINPIKVSKDGKLSIEATISTE